VKIGQKINVPQSGGVPLDLSKLRLKSR